MKIVWHKHNLMISSSFGSGQYLWGISYKYLPGWGILSGKIISIKRNHHSNLGFIFKQRFPFSHVLALFQDNFISGEATSSHFFRVTTSTQQLYFRSSYFLRAAAFFSFIRTVTLSQQLFFQNSFFFRAEILQSSHFLRIRSSLS